MLRGPKILCRLNFLFIAIQIAAHHCPCLIVSPSICNQLFGVWFRNTLSYNSHNSNSWLLQSSHRWNCRTANKLTEDWYIVQTKNAIFDTTNQKNTDLLNDAKLINTSAVGWAAQAASTLQRKIMKQKWEIKTQNNLTFTPPPHPTHSEWYMFSDLTASEVQNIYHRVDSWHIETTHIWLWIF